MIDPINLPNNCFSIVDEETSEEKKELYSKQRMERGFDNTELWNLDTTILRFALPRLQAFITEEVEGFGCYPSVLQDDYPDCENLYEKWKEILNEMVTGIKQYIGETETDTLETPNGVKLFLKYFTDLWS